MIEEALYGHLIGYAPLCDQLASYGGVAAVFNQKAPADTDPLWDEGPQYPRLVFAVDIQGDPARTMGGTLAVDIMSKESGAPPEVLEPIVREAIDDYFFSSGTFTVAAQWQSSSYFTDPTEEVVGCTLNFALLGFPVITTDGPDLVARFNAWSLEQEGLHVINAEPLPSSAWKPDEANSAIYWRVVQDKDCTWIPSTYQTLWREAICRAHIFAQNPATEARIARHLAAQLHADKRLMKDGESPIMVNRDNSVDNTADPLKTGQLTVDATYAIIVAFENTETLDSFDVKDGGLSDG
ncbi:MAG: hypothetical protein Q4C56_04050 [Peptococcaceae bacterium]|nr:hypothetical protein [Peptococcaceae bacterium]